MRNRTRWLVVPVALALVAAAGLAVLLRPGAETPSLVPEPLDFTLSPGGGEVPRLTPVRVTFERRPREREGERLLQLEPPAPGAYTWVGERTLQFQPEFPGLLRGQRYIVRLPALPEAGLPSGANQEFTTEGRLTVDYVMPGDGEAEVPLDGQILVQFSRSVAPLTLLSEPGSSPALVADPPLAGQGEWLNTSLYRFVPEALLPNTIYRLRIPAGLSSAADGVLAGDFTWGFTTLQPALAQATPDQKTQFVGPRQEIVLTFNQPMERGSVAAGFTLNRADGAAARGTWSWSEGDAVARFTPAAPLDGQTRYEMVVPRGLKGARGGETQREWRSSFTTAGAPSVSKTEPASGGTGASRYGAQIVFGNPMNRGSVEDRLSVSGIDSREVRLYWQNDQTLQIGVTLKPSTRYTITVAEGATDRYGQPLAPYRWSFTTGALPATVSFAVPSQMATFSAGVEPLLYFHAWNLSEVSFTLYPLTPEETRSLQQSGFIQTGRTAFRPSQDPLRSWTEMPGGRLDEIVLKATSLSGGGPLPRGDYYVTSGGDFRSHLVFSVVDTALVTKLSHTELLAWALDYETGRPLAGVKVRATGPGLTEAEQTTDADGLASFAVPNPQSLTQPRAYRITLEDGGHRGVSSTLWQQGSQPYQLNLPVESVPREYVGHLYTERPIYRPGERVEYKGVLRLDDDGAYRLPPASPPLDLVILDPLRQELRREPVQANEFGTFAGTLRLSDAAATGDYSLAIRPAQRQGNIYRPFIADTSFLVAEFRKPEFQVALETAQTSYVDGDLIPAQASASFFFGGPLTGAPVRWSAESSPFVLRVPGFAGYSFADHDGARLAEVRQTSRAEGSAVTGADGRAAFSLRAALTGNEGAQEFRISATVADQNAQEASASATVAVHPAALYAGIRPERYVATAGQEATIQLVTVDTAGKPLPHQAISVRIYERTWVTTKEQASDGSRRYRSEPSDSLATTLTTTTDAGALGSVRFTPSSAGTWRLVAEVADPAGRRARSATELWVSGQGRVSWQVTNDDALKLVADKESYEVGDTAEVLVPAPFEGSLGLVTVERGKVITRTMRSFPSTSERLSIPIVDAYVPNVFVSVILYKPPTAADPLPRYKVGYVKLPVSTASRVLQVAIQPDRAQARPGDKVRYDLKVTDSSGRGVRAELSVAVVDKAILSLADERGPTGLKAFWFERGLGVFTASSLAVSVNRSNDVIAEARAEGKGGGGLEADRLRQDFRNTAFWQAQLVTGEDGSTSVDVTMPDDVTTWRLQARAVSGGTMVGEATNELLSTEPLLLRPALPRFLRVGDSATLRLLVRNATPAPASLSVALAAEGLDLTGERTRSATVAPGTSALLEWPARATAEGKARLTFSATGPGGLRDAVVQELPVYQDVTPESTATGGFVAAQPVSETVFLPAYALVKEGALDVQVQPTLVGSLADELATLAPQSYEGVERTASRVIASVALRRAEKSGQAAGGASSDGLTDSDLSRLVARQKPDGGWAWQGEGPSDPNITGWVMLALAAGRREGHTVDDVVLSRAALFLRGQLSPAADVDHPADVNQRAFLLYALATAGSPNRGAILALQEQYRARLTNWGRAYLLLAMAVAEVAPEDSHVRSTLNDLTAAAIASATGNHWEDAPQPEGMHTSLRTTAVALSALVRIDPTHPLIEETVRHLVVARGAQGWVTTVERAEAILALSDFAAGTGELAGAYAYRVRLDEKEILQGRFAATEDGRGRGEAVPLTSLLAGREHLLSFARDFAEPGRLYYRLFLHYRTPAAAVEARNRGVAVARDYSHLAEATRRIDRARLGDTVRVRVTVVAPSDLNYVVVEDLLPAGLEPVDPQLKTVDPKLKARLEAERAEGLQGKQPGGVAPWHSWYYSPWQHVDTRDDRVVLYADRLPKGVHEYIYYARATSAGDYYVGPAHAEETYFPEVFGRTDSARFTVEP